MIKTTTVVEAKREFLKTRSSGGYEHVDISRYESEDAARRFSRRVGSKNVNRNAAACSVAYARIRRLI